MGCVVLVDGVGAFPCAEEIAELSMNNAPTAKNLKKKLRGRTVVVHYVGMVRCASRAMPRHDAEMTGVT